MPKRTSHIKGDLLLVHKYKIQCVLREGKRFQSHAELSASLRGEFKLIIVLPIDAEIKPRWADWSFFLFTLHEQREPC